MATHAWPLSAGLLEGEWRWPEEGRVSLLLDGVRVRDLVFQLREWSGGHYHGDPLYAGTPFSVVQHLSPWLLSLSGPDDPVLRRFLVEGLEDEWGYLLVGRAGHQALASHLRSLLQVRVTDDAPMLLRVADPAVIGALLPAERSVAEAPWGPIDRLIVPDGVMGQWRAWSPADNPGHLPALTVPPGGHRLDASEQRRLRACDRRTELRHLLRFVQSHCPDWLDDPDPAGRYARLDALTREAAPWGLQGPRQWQRLCVLMSRLGLVSLETEAFPEDLREILSDTRRGDGEARLKEALARLNLKMRDEPSAAPAEEAEENATPPVREAPVPASGAAASDALALDAWLGQATPDAGDIHGR